MKWYWKIYFDNFFDSLALLKANSAQSIGFLNPETLPTDPKHGGSNCIIDASASIDPSAVLFEPIPAFNKPLS